MNFRTIIVIFAFIILAFYTLNEVSYFSTKTNFEENSQNPVLSIPKINVLERVNNVSLNYGVYLGSSNSNPLDGDIVLFGHRTLQGSAFLRLNELDNGDEIILNYLNLGEFKYKINSIKVISEHDKLNINNNVSKITLITCHPIGQTSQRLIVTGDLIEIGNVNKTLINENPQEHFGIYISLAFLLISLIFTYFYPKEDRLIILILIIILSTILFYFTFNPTKWRLLSTDFTHVLNFIITKNFHVLY